MRKLTVDNLTDFEADHISEILTDYKHKMLMLKLEAMAEDRKNGGNFTTWFDNHIAWHEEVMKKCKWEVIND